MPLEPGKSQKTFQHNMQELHTGPHHAKMVKEFGAKKAAQIDAAIAYRKKRESK